MKIAIVDPWCFTPPYNHALCIGLLSMGHEVTLIGQDGGDGHQADSLSEVTTLGLFSAPASWIPRSLILFAKGLMHVRGMFRVLATLRELRPDVIHFQWLALPVIDALFIPLLRRIAPVVLTAHDSNPYNGAGPWLLRAGNMMAIRRFDRWIVHNDLSERHLVERGLPDDRIHRVAHGLLSQGVAERKPLDRDPDAPIHFLQFGKLKDYKGVDVLLTALGGLGPEQRRRCRVSIVGRAYIETQPLLDLLARHHLDSFVDLRFDFVSDEEMAALFDDADFLVFPYRGIDTSGVLMAAIASGIPVVASNLGCFAEMLTDGEEGVLVPPDDPKALAQALIGLIEAPEQRLLMRAGMEALKRRIPSWNKIAETTTLVYELAQAPQAERPIGAHP